MRPVCIVMLKAPRAGSAKTRLAPPLTHALAASLAECFARDVTANMRRVVRDVIIAYAPSDARAEIEESLALNVQRPKRPDDLSSPSLEKLPESVAPVELHWLEQKGEDLGARLEAAFAEAHALGFGPIVVVGSDSPTLPPSYVERAFQTLARDEADVALGPTEDGGYYLVGLRKPFGTLFRNVAWSTAETFKQTLANAARLRLSMRELPRWYDVDEFSDLLRLREELNASEEARSLAPSTHRWILTHDALLSSPA